MQLQWKSNIQILKDAVFNHQFSILRRSRERILFGLAVVETLDKTTLESNPNPILYRLGWRVLEKLNEKNQNYWMILTFFFYQLSLRLGFMPNLKKCSKCNLEITHGCFDDLIGELVCLDCNSKSKINLSAESLNLLRRVEKIHIDNLGGISIKNNLIMESILFLEFFLTFQLEGLRKIQSLKIIRQVINPDSNLKAWNINIRARVFGNIIVVLHLRCPVVSSFYLLPTFWYSF